MQLWRKPWFIPIVLTILIILAGQYYTIGNLTQANTLSKEEISTQLATIYDSEVSEMTLKGDVYEAKLLRSGAEYVAKVDSASGEVLSLIQTKEADIAPLPEVIDAENEQQLEEKQPGSETTPAPPSVPSTPKENQPENEPQSTFITKEQAADIGMAQLPTGMIGEVDDIDFEYSSDGGYYLVEIDIDTDDELDEVTYQIHAISGKIMSVTWDD